MWCEFLVTLRTFSLPLENAGELFLICIFGMIFYHFAVGISSQIGN